MLPVEFGSASGAEEREILRSQSEILPARRSFLAWGYGEIIHI